MEQSSDLETLTMSIIGVYVWWSAINDPTITNYKVYCGTAPGSYTDPNSPKTVGNVLDTVYSVSGAGRYYFAIAGVSSVTGESLKGTEFYVDVTEPVGVITHLVRRPLLI